MRGFTLIEIMLVVAILAMLVAVVAPRIMGRYRQARYEATQLQIAQFKVALGSFYLDNGFYPWTEQGLRALVQKPVGGPPIKHYPEGGYLDRIPKDPWGREYIYRSPGIHRKDYEIICLGADGKEGGEGYNADILSCALGAE